MITIQRQGVSGTAPTAAKLEPAVWDPSHKAPVAVKAQAAVPAPKPATVANVAARNLEPTTKVESKAVKLLNVRAALASVSNAEPDVKPVSNGAEPDVKPVSNGAARIARWRAKQDPEVRKQRNREAVRRSRAKRKAGKAGGS